MRIVDLKPVESLVMTSGIGDFSNTACVVAQAAILDALEKGHKLTSPTDDLECACPVLRRLAIALNDIDWWDSDKERTESLRLIIPALLDSRVGPMSVSKRAKLSSDFALVASKYGAKYAEYAEYAAKYAAKSAKSAKSAKYAESAEYARYAAESAKCAAKSAEYAESAAESAAKYVESAKYGAEYAEYAAKYAAEYAANSAKYAESAAEYVKSAKSAAEYAAKCAKYVTKSATKPKELQEKLLKTFWLCEGIKDEVTL